MDPIHALLLLWLMRRSDLENVEPNEERPGRVPGLLDETN